MISRVASVGIVASIWVTAACAAATDKDFDLACAIASAAETGTETNTPEDRRLAFNLNVYFLGRLSGRDGGTYWYGVVVGKVSELKDKARSREMYLRCADFFTKQVG